MTFVEVPDPYADEPNDTAPAAQVPSTTSDAYQQVAAHTLEALSAAAADHPPYPPATNFPDYNVYASHEVTQPVYGPARTELAPSGSQTNNISFLLNPSQTHTPSSLIDPSLESSVVPAVDQAHEARLSASPRQERHESKDEPDNRLGESDSRVAFVLKSFTDGPM